MSPLTLTSFSFWPGVHVSPAVPLQLESSSCQMHFQQNQLTLFSLLKCLSRKVIVATESHLQPE